MSIDVHACRGLRQSPRSAANLRWDDPFILDKQFKEDDRAICDTAPAHARDKPLRHVLKAHLEEKADRHIFRETGEPGRLTLSAEYGCINANHVACGLEARDIERAESDYRSPMKSVQLSMAMHPIHAYGDENPRKKYLPKLAAGEWGGCFDLTEPDADPVGKKTRAGKPSLRLSFGSNQR